MILKHVQYAGQIVSCVGHISSPFSFMNVSPPFVWAIVTSGSIPLTKGSCPEQNGQLFQLPSPARICRTRTEPVRDASIPVQRWKWIPNRGKLKLNLPRFCEAEELGIYSSVSIESRQAHLSLQH